jgi:hypothetical protein
MGFDPTETNFIPFSSINSTYLFSLEDTVLYPIEKLGVDFWWNDYSGGGLKGGSTGKK